MKSIITQMTFVPLLVALLTTWLLTPLVIRLANAVGMVDKPDPRRIHNRITPRGGGLAVIAGFHIAGLTMFALRNIAPELAEAADWWLRILPATLFLAMIGVIDDRFGMKPVVKLGGQIIAGLMAYVAGIHFGHVLNLDLPMPIDVALTVGWFLGFVNAFNLIDGLDGLASGLAMIASIGLAGALWLRGAGNQLPLALALLGAALAFLRYNFFPARIFLGDTGSMFLGFTLAALAMTGRAKGTFLVSVIVPALAVGVPVLDTVLAVWRRSVRRWNQKNVMTDEKSQTNVFGADADHLHHRLLKEWKSQRAVAGYLYLLNALIAGAGLAAAALHSYSTAIFISALVTAAVVLFRHAAYIEIWDSSVAIVQGLMRPRRKGLASLFYPAADASMLGCAWLVAELLARGSSWHIVSRQSAIECIGWIGLPFIALCLAGAYKRVWSMARLSDLALLFLALSAGMMLSAALRTIHEHAVLRDVLITMLVMASTAITGILGTRVLPRTIQDLLPRLWHRRRNATINAPLRTLVYSASSGCTLFLRTLAQSGITEIKARHIVGLLDEDTNLHNRIVYGLPVFGNFDDTEYVVRQHAINEIVVAQPLTCFQKRVLQTLSHRMNVRVLYWTAGLVLEPMSLSIQTDHQMEEVA